MPRPLAWKLASIASPLILLLPLSACGGGDTVDQKSSAASSEKSEPEKKSEAESVILETGFGQSDEYVTVATLVENKTDHGGQTVTVSFNIKDESGELIKTDSQVESFSYGGQKLAVVGFTDLKPGQKAASVDSTLLVEEDGIGTESDLNLDPVEASIDKGEYGETTASFKVKNPTAEALQDLRIGIVCKGKDGKVNGGSTEYPDLVPPSGEIVVDSDVMVSGKPASCTAYIGPGI